MKIHPSLAAFVISVFLSPPLCHAQSLPDLPGFKQPLSKCQQPSTSLIITQAGTFPITLDDSNISQVVATVQPTKSQITITDHAAITIFDNQCHLLYRQVFPAAGEVTFETVQWNEQTLLHIVTVSAVAEPADEVIYNHIFLDGSLLPVQPPDLISDKFNSIFVGNIGQGKGFGIVETFQITLGQKPPLVTPFSIMFRLQDIPLREGQSLAAFTGPTVIRPPPRTNPSTAWPDTSYKTGFPLMHYLFPGSSGY